MKYIYIYIIFKYFLYYYALKKVKIKKYKFLCTLETIKRIKKNARFKRRKNLESLV